jgi:tRNA pseudouridine65 synthase
VVRGYIEAQGRIDHPLRPFNEAGLRGAVAQTARTYYRRLATVEIPVAVSRYATSRYALVEAHPVTGRMHQIRRHLRHSAHPVIGDKRYGDARHNRFFKHHLQCDRLLLAAVELAFKHPYSGADVTITARLGEQLDALLCRLGWHAFVPDRWAKSMQGSGLNI